MAKYNAAKSRHKKTNMKKLQKHYRKRATLPNMLKKCFKLKEKDQIS